MAVLVRMASSRFKTIFKNKVESNRRGLLMLTFSLYTCTYKDTHTHKYNHTHTSLSSLQFFFKKDDHKKKISVLKKAWTQELVRCLFCKHEDLNLIPSTQIKDHAWWLILVIPVLRRQEKKGSLWFD